MNRYNNIKNNLKISKNKIQNYSQIKNLWKLNFNN